MEFLFSLEFGCYEFHFSISISIGFFKKTVIIKGNMRKKDPQLFAIKLTEKISDPCNAKKHYQLFIRTKNTESVKESKIIT